MHLISLWRETPRPLVAIVGLASAVLTRELGAASAAHRMVEGSTSQYGFIAAAAIIALFALLYWKSPRFRLSDNRPVLIAVAILAAGSATLLFSAGSMMPAWRRSVLFGLYQSSAIVLVIAWFEAIISLGSRRVGLIYFGSVAAYAQMNPLILLIRQDLMPIVDFLLPLISVILLVFWQRGSKAIPEALAGSTEISTPFPQNHLMAVSYGRSQKRTFLMLAAIVLVTLFCCRFAFGFVNSEWMILQNSSDFSVNAQLMNFVGTVLAAVFLALLLEKCWNQSTSILLLAVLAPSLLGCLFCLSLNAVVPALLGLALLAFGQRVVLLLALLTPFILDAKNPPAVLCISMAIVMVSLGLFSVASLQLNAPAAAGLAIMAAVVPCVMQIALIALLNGNAGEPSVNVNRRIAESSFNSDAVRSVDSAIKRDNTQEALAVAQRCGLTQRETEVLLLLANRYNAQAIADVLVISETTAKTHMRKIYAKLGVHTQRELISYIEESSS